MKVGGDKAGAHFDANVFSTLKNGNEAMKSAQAEAGVEKFEDLRDDIEVRTLSGRM